MSIPIKKYVALLMALTGFAAASSAAAGSFSLSPIRIELGPRIRTEALTVRNEGTDSVVVQAQIFAWSQSDGQDVLTETRDVLVTPPVFMMKGSGQQIVRVALRRAADSKRQLTYRLILQEVQPDAPRTSTGLQVALRLSVPIFVAPQSGAKPQLHWNATWKADGSLLVAAHNQGDHHIQVIDFAVTARSSSDGMKNSVVKYVLPGSTMTWKLPPPADTQALNALKQGPLILRGASDQGEISADLIADGG